MEFPGGGRKEATHRCRFPDPQFDPCRPTEQAAGTSGGTECDAPAPN